MIEAKSTLIPTVRDHSHEPMHYFDKDMKHCETDWLIEKPEIVQFHTGPDKDVKLYLHRNVWTLYDPNIRETWAEQAGGYVVNKAGFVFRYCIVCAQKRFEILQFKGMRLHEWDSPLVCFETKCKKTISELKNEFHSSGLINAIFERNADALKGYLVSPPKSQIINTLPQENRIDISETRFKDVKRGGRICYYFDSSMDISQATTPEITNPKTIRFEYPCKHKDHDYCMLHLFLVNNLWVHYEPIAGYGYADHRAGFVFHNCIVCGENRFKYENFFQAHCPAWESPINCGESKCSQVIYDLQFQDEGSRELFSAIWRREIKTLKYHSRNSLAASTLSNRIATTFGYFDDEMKSQETKDPSAIKLKKLTLKLKCKHESHKYCVKSLFLPHNPWKNYDPISEMEHRAGFVFRNCVFCGENRFKKGDFASARLDRKSSPIECGKDECLGEYYSLLFGNQPFRHLHMADVSIHDDPIEKWVEGLISEHKSIENVNDTSKK